MPTIVDSLVVTLGLDASGFTRESGTINVFLKNTRDDADKTAKEMEAKGKQASQFFTQIKNEALGLLGVLLGGRGLEEFTRSATRSLADLGREAKNIGMSVPDLDAFRTMIVANGGSAEEATASLRGLTDEMERFKVTGESGIIKYLNAVGAKRGDTAMDVYMDFVRFAEAHKNDVPLINLIGRGLGFDQGSINEAMKGAAQVRKDLEEARKSADTGSMTESAAKLQHDWEMFAKAMDHAANVVYEKIQPALSWLLKWATDIAQRYPEATQVIIEGTGAFVVLLSVLTGARILLAVTGLGSLGTAIGGVATAMTGIIATAAGFAAALGVIVAASVDTWEHFGLNQHEADALNEWRKSQGLPPLPSGGAGTPLTPDAQHDYERAHPAETWWKRHAPTWLGGDPDATGADTAPPEGQALLDQIAVGESGGRYDVRYGGLGEGDKTFSGYADHPRVYEKTTGGQVSSAAGKYQFTATTWDDVQKTLHLPDFSPHSQEVAGWYLAQRTYRNNGGGDLLTDLKAARGDKAKLDAIARRMSHEWTSAPGGSEHNAATDGFVDGLSRRLAAVPAPPPGATIAPRPVDPALAGAGARSRLTPSVVGSTAPGERGDTNVTIGEVNVHTKATDARGIASDFGGALNDTLINQANRGLT